MREEYHDSYIQIKTFAFRITGSGIYRSLATAGETKPSARTISPRPRFQALVLLQGPPRNMVDSPVRSQA